MTPREADWLALTLVEGVGQKTIQALLHRFGDVGALLDASPGEIRKVRGIGPELAARISNAREVDACKIETRLVEENAIRLIPLDAADYPALLRETDVPPALLYERGSLPGEEVTCLAVVGTRRASRYGEKVTRKLIEGLAAIDPGMVIVSGLARGIDTAAHQQALDSGLKTVAVMAGGLTGIYPPENRELAGRVAEQGALITEFPMTAAPIAKNFPIRNRVISGLCRGVLVVEAGEKSGALITAGFALNHNRELFAVPGNIDLASFEGSNRLLQTGQAKLVREAEDILEELGSYQRAAPARRKARKDRERRPAAHAPPGSDKFQVIGLLQKGPLHPDELSREAEMPMEKLLGVLLELELAGDIYQTAENQYAIS